jgi:hypothetical protein
MALTRRQLLMVALEGSYGTSATPIGTDALLVLDPSLTPLDAQVIERAIIDPAFGRVRSRILAQRKMGLAFGVEATGSGTAGTAPKYGPLLQACGLSLATVASTSNTYSPATPATDSVTLNHNWDGNKHEGTGARGTFELAMTAGEIPRFNFTMTGIYGNGPTDVAFPTPTYTNQAQPLDVSASNTTSVSVAGLSACMAEFSLNCNNTIEFFDHAGCTKQARITDRMVEGSITIERPDLLSTKDFYAQAIAGTTGSISFTHGTTAGNRMVVTISTANFGPPEPADLRGIAGLKIPFVALHTAGSSNEFSLAFT